MNAPRTESPVRASDRVNDVLARDEALVEVFIRHSANFSRLRNRTMRRVMGRLVTIQDASRIAGVPLDVLLRDLNGALGIPAAGASAPELDAVLESAEPLLNEREHSHPRNAPVVEVDVRDDLHHGREPFARITAAVSALRAGEVLRVRSIFQPAPLITLLVRRGFVHESTANAPDDWSVWFWRDETLSPRTGADAELSMAAPLAAGSPSMTGDAEVVWLDVRGLQPPEPLVRTLAALDSLPPAAQLVQVNVRVPQLLLPMLAERGFACEVDESHADRVLVRIWHPA